ncbi:MAG: hypothetical protein D6785_13980 [Planctomycetota bacterium]|nr:MAG: hypothetical protein D6785_13980 [Planctomycetota bacterium]
MSSHREKALEIAKNQIPEGWSLREVRHLCFSKGERFAFMVERNNPFSEGYEKRAIFITCFADKVPQVIIQDEDSMEKEYDSLRRTMEGVKKDASIYFNVLITLLSGSIVGIGMGYELTILLTGIFIFLLFLIHLYFQQVLFAKRQRTNELELCLGYDHHTIISLSKRAWLVQNTPILVFVLFSLAFAAGILWKFLR